LFFFCYLRCADTLLATALHQLASAVAFLAANHVPHHSLCAGSVLLAHPAGAIKVCDHGLHYLLPSFSFNDPRYLAPEILLTLPAQREQHLGSDAASVWAFGLLAIEAATGVLPTATLLSATAASTPGAAASARWSPQQLASALHRVSQLLALDVAVSQRRTEQLRRRDIWLAQSGVPPPPWSPLFAALTDASTSSSSSSSSVLCAQLPADDEHDTQRFRVPPSLLRACLVGEPALRVSAAQLPSHPFFAALATAGAHARVAQQCLPVCLTAHTLCVCVCVCVCVSSGGFFLFQLAPDESARWALKPQLRCAALPLRSVSAAAVATAAAADAQAASGAVVPGENVGDLYVCVCVCVYECARCACLLLGFFC
jgi:hypothetical protein